jgi:hypothetical protein
MTSFVIPKGHKNLFEILGLSRKHRSASGTLVFTETTLTLALTLGSISKRVMPEV